MVYTSALGADGRKIVEVRVLSRAQKYDYYDDFAKIIKMKQVNKNLPTDDLDEIEEELKEQKKKEEKTHQKVSGKSVFGLREIIKKKAGKKDENKKS